MRDRGLIQFRADRFAQSYAFAYLAIFLLLIVGSSIPAQSLPQMSFFDENIVFDLALVVSVLLVASIFFSFGVDYMIRALLGIASLFLSWLLMNLLSFTTGFLLYSILLAPFIATAVILFGSCLKEDSLNKQLSAFALIAMFVALVFHIVCLLNQGTILQIWSFSTSPFITPMLLMIMPLVFAVSYAKEAE